MLYQISTLIGFQVKEKNPNDRSKCNKSTPWGYESYCEGCLGVVTTHDQITNNCPNCGIYLSSLGNKSRSRRKIWNGKKWVTQLSYGHELKII